MHNDPLYDLPAFAQVAHDPTASAYDTEGVIEVAPAIAQVERTNARRIPPPPSVRKGFAKGFVAPVNAPNSSTIPPEVGASVRPNQIAPVGVCTAQACDRKAKVNIDRLMRQPRS